MILTEKPKFYRPVPEHPETTIGPGVNRALLEDIRQVALEMSAIKRRGEQEAEALRQAKVIKKRRSPYNQAGLDQLAEQGLLVEGDFTGEKMITVFEEGNRDHQEIATIPINRGTKMYPEVWTLLLPRLTSDLAKHLAPKTKQ